MPRPLNRERTVFTRNGAGKTGYPTCKRMKVDPYLTQYTKVYLKMDQRPTCKS